MEQAHVRLERAVAFNLPYRYSRKTLALYEANGIVSGPPGESGLMPGRASWENRTPNVLEDELDGMAIHQTYRVSVVNAWLEWRYQWALPEEVSQTVMGEPFGKERLDVLLETSIGDLLSGW